MKPKQLDTSANAATPVLTSDCSFVRFGEFASAAAN